jgi:hypothetical protein
MSLEKRYQTWKKRRKDWSAKVFFFGLSGLIAVLVTLFTGVEDLAWPTLKLGLKLVLSAYVFIIMLSPVVWICCNLKMKKIRVTFEKKFK